MKYKYIQVIFWVSALFFTGYGAYADQFPVVIEAEVKATLSAERSGVLSQLSVDTGDTIKKRKRRSSCFSRRSDCEKTAASGKQEISGCSGRKP